MILERIERHDHVSDPGDIVARASFLTNICHGSKILNSFQMAMGYTPSILGIPRQHVPQELMDAHVHLTATRAIHKLIRKRRSNTVRRELLKPGTAVYMFHKSSKHTEPVKWEEATVVSTPSM